MIGSIILIFAAAVLIIENRARKNMKNDTSKSCCGGNCECHVENKLNDDTGLSKIKYHNDEKEVINWPSRCEYTLGISPVDNCKCKVCEKVRENLKNNLCCGG